MFFILTGAPRVPARDVTASALVTGQIAAERSFDPLSADDALALAHIEVGLELEEVLPGLTLELAWETGTQSGDLFAGDQPWLRTELMIQGVVLSAAWRLPVTTWLHGVARMGATCEFARLRLEEDGEVLLTDWANARLGGFASLGAEFILPRNLWRRWVGAEPGDDHEGFTLGIRLEAGWSLRQPYTFDEMHPADAGGIDRARIDLGSIDLSGFMFRAGLVAFF
jgi:hypothetical protein